VWLSTHPGSREPTVRWGLCFAMGLQNALVTRVSGAVVRTTHVTVLYQEHGAAAIALLRVTATRPGSMGSRVRDARGPVPA
jgi:hypothetical protein